MNLTQTEREKMKPEEMLQKFEEMSGKYTVSEEILNLMKESSAAIVAAKIKLYDDVNEEFNIFELAPNFTLANLQEFLIGLNVDYNSGYGRQYLFGTVWFDDGTWAGRTEYDGAENWVIVRKPEFNSYDFKNINE